MYVGLSSLEIVELIRIRIRIYTPVNYLNKGKSTLSGRRPHLTKATTAFLVS